MSEYDRLIGIVRSLTGVLEATRSKPMLHQLVSMALVVASEDLVKRGFDPARLCELGVTEEVAYLLDAACRPSPNVRLEHGISARFTYCALSPP
jgi:hypothetical protein